ncbi:uncharacterized protein LOC123263401 [Cotesia glomerata]|uniref:uncharacterized protein LOC123263401 n=1 Tax=Cotesia glomerata TaxID=32391 RepID=UPI001D0050D1|nr:uncharacterized protein LOC123263401 [Cotesia glomerata]
MPKCIAPYCNNSSEQGYVLKSLPTNEKLRAIWIENITRKYTIKDWSPTADSRLCEVHFAPEMWENRRLDNLQKLKKHAVPTIFGHHITKKTFIARSSKSTQTENDELALQVIRTSVSNCDQSTSTEEGDSDSQKLATLRRAYSVVRNRIKSLQLKNKVLTDVLRTDKYRTALYSLFNEDQVQYLITDQKKLQHWSHETVERAVKLRTVCGTHGYKELQSQGIPLPCLRVLQRSRPKVYSQSETPQSTTTLSSEELLSIINDDWD